jgi:hypothetical protein
MPWRQTMERRGSRMPTEEGTEITDVDVHSESSIRYLLGGGRDTFYKLFLHLDFK